MFPGCVIGVLQNGTSQVFPFGHFTYDEDSPLVENDTFYDLASITKSIPLASLAAIFIAEGKLQLSDKVRMYIPELRNDYDATIEDLLRYRVKGPRMSVLAFRTFEQIRTHIFERGFDGPPGKSEYSNLPAYVLGVVLERVGEASLAKLGHRYMFEPLAMAQTTFFPSASSCVPTEIQNGTIVQGIVHDESARLFVKARRSVGHAGLFSSSGDLLKFANALLQGKFPAVVESAQKGLGWTVDQAWFMGTHVSKGTFGKTGFTGTSIVIDPTKKKALVILSNRTYPARPVDATSLTSAVNIFRRDVADIVFG